MERRGGRSGGRKGGKGDSSVKWETGRKKGRIEGWTPLEMGNVREGGKEGIHLQNGMKREGKSTWKYVGKRSTSSHMKERWKTEGRNSY